MIPPMAKRMVLSDFDIGLIQSRRNSTGTRLKRHTRQQVLVNRDEHGSSTDRQNSTQRTFRQNGKLRGASPYYSLESVRPHPQRLDIMN